ncbi:hypothetical protein L226DRAFT_539233 [Lentinus tigrinus ALCF2SS1-7]|uniref:uncharacterized protein n=1 Tax=Lentinus tigrinus ALCF2SS1-7 TaxID=1328758 RepID=UPI001165E722|nr:hypothetical protein L226DRAFT_539233 [Lentinus tigrinus ALCF2SS1-7]
MLPRAVRTAITRDTIRTSCSVALKPDTLYSTDERTRNQCIHRALEERKRLGFKKEGACHVEIAGGYHFHEQDDKSGEWVTVLYRDRENRVVRYRKADGSVWDRVHVHRDAELAVVQRLIPMILQ